MNVTELWTEMMKQVPWQFKLLWIIGAFISFSLLGAIFWLIAVLIKHFS